MRLVTMVVRGRWIVNRRTKLIYKPAIVDRLSGFWDETERSRELAEILAGLGAEPELEV